MGSRTFPFFIIAGQPAFPVDFKVGQGGDEFDLSSNTANHPRNQVADWRFTGTAPPFAVDGEREGV
jgi:hypothetical protein